MAPNQTPARPGQELHCGEAGAHRMSEVKPSGFIIIHHESSWIIMVYLWSSVWFSMPKYASCFIHFEAVSCLLHRHCQRLFEKRSLSRSRVGSLRLYPHHKCRHAGDAHSRSQMIADLYHFISQSGCLWNYRRRLKILKPLSQASFQKRRLDGARLFVANLAQAEKLQFFWRSRGMLVDRTTCKFATGQRLVKTRSQYHPDVGSPQEGQACGISSVCNVKRA